MSFFTGSKSQAAQQTVLSGLQLQSSSYGKAIPLVYGTTRIAPNLIWYGDFVATPQSSAGSGGKGGITGGGGKGGGSSSYTYQTAVALGLCEGPVQAIDSVYIDNTITSLAALGLSFFAGTYPQSPWGYLLAQNAVSAETQTIPASSPYTITLTAGSGFYQDAGVTLSADTAYVSVNGTPSAGQYSVQFIYQDAIYTFNAADAGADVTVTVHDTLQGTVAHNAVVPAAAPYQITISATVAGFRDEGVVATGTPLAPVAGSPASGQYSFTPGGVYTFNAVQAGQTVTMNFYTFAGTQALGYNGIAYVASPAYQLGSSAALPNHNFEVLGVYSDTLLSLGVPDADPSQVVADLLTNPHYGIGFPTERVGDLSVYQGYCIANGLWISPAYTDQTQASSMLDDISTATNSAFVWSNGVLTLVPYGDEAMTANGYSYTPPSAPLYDLSDDDFMPNTNATETSSATVNDDPVLLTRTRQSDAYNAIQLECLDRTNSYNTAIVEAKDQAFIETFGLRQAPSAQMHMFADLNAGQMSARLQLQRQSIRNTYQFTLDQRYVLLDPMDIVTLTDSYLGLNEQWVRITEITENDDCTLTVAAEEYLAGTGSAPLYSYQQGQGFGANYNASPGNANMPVIFEPTALLAEGLEVWLAASGGALWGGCDVYISSDGDSYKNVGTISGPARTGVLTAPLPAVTPAATGQTIDTTDTLSVDLSQSGGQLLSGSQADATSLATLCYADGEYIAYQNATLTGSNAYDLTYLVRAAYGTTPGAHAAGALFARLDDSIFKFSYTQDFIGTTLYIKLVSFNIYGGGQQTLGSVQPYAYTITGLALSSPLPDVANLCTSYVAALTQLSWDNVQDFRSVLYEVRKGAAWTGAQVLGRVAQPPFCAQGDGTYWVSAYSQPVAGLQVYSENPQDLTITGAQITSNVIVTYDEAASGWGGTLGGTAAVVGGSVITSGAGNILTDPDYLNTPDILYYGEEGDGTYEIPSAHQINVGRVAPCSIIITWMSIGQHIYDNILIAPDFLGFSDLLDYAASANVNVYPEIALSQDGVTWGAWQKYAAGSYVAMAYKARMQLQTYDPTVEALLSAFTFAVDVPDRDDHYVNLSVPGGGLSLSFTPDGSSTPTPFNGGTPGSSVPAIQVTILSAQAGDIASITSVTLSGCTIQILNGGSGVARTVNVLVEGY